MIANRFAGIRVEGAARRSVARRKRAGVAQSFAGRTPSRRAAGTERPGSGPGGASSSVFRVGLTTRASDRSRAPSHAMDAPSYRLVPAAGPHASSSSSTSIGSTSAPSAPVHDALRFGGPRNLVAEAHAASAHPLQHRLEAWSDTQEGFKLRTLGDLYGVHAPLRRVMEKRIVGKVRVCAFSRPKCFRHAAIAVVTKRRLRLSLLPCWSDRQGTFVWAPTRRSAMLLLD